MKYRNPQLNSVQNETNTVINFPTPKKEGFLEILGESDESIEEAEKHIHCFIADIRNQLSPLQFIAIPLLSDEIKHNFEEFKVGNYIYTIICNIEIFSKLIIEGYIE